MELGIDGLTSVEEIGRGGFGVVYRAFDELHGRQVAVKVLTGLLDDSARRRFDRERRAMGTLSGHPNIAVVHTSGFNPQGQPYIVMEYLDGGSLEDKLQGGVLGVDEAVEIGLALCDALEMAHQHGVLHLDVKPSNVLMSGFGTPKLVDFGIATLAGDDQATSTIRATPAYAAPEIFDGEPPSTAADIYGLGATMYALLMGAAPYSTSDNASALQILREVAISPVPQVERADVTSDLRDLLSAAMAKDPSGRPASTAELSQRLRALSSTAVPPPAGQASHLQRSSEPPEQPLDPAQPGAPAPSPGRGGGNGDPSRRAGFALLGLAALIALIAAIIVVTRGDGDPVITTDDPVPSPAATTPTSEPATVRTEVTPTPNPPRTPLPPPTRIPLPVVPDVVGLLEADAMAVLAGAGYEPIINFHCFFTVTNTFPAPGAALAAGERVELLFDPCVVPDFVGLRLDVAVAIIDEIGAMRVEWPDHCDDIVLGQSIEAGTTVAPGTTVFLDLPAVC